MVELDPQPLMLVIPHATEDLVVLYNGNGKHDKIYVIARMKDFSGKYHLYGFYKARTAKAFRWTLLASEYDPVKLHNSFSYTYRQKIQKGYERIQSDGDLKNLGLENLQSLAKRLTDLAYSGKELSAGEASTGEEVEISDYECLDDFGFQGVFAIGCLYPGYWRGSKLTILDDDKKPHEVDSDNFVLTGG